MATETIRAKLVDELSELLSRAGRITDHLRDAPPSDWEELATFRENDEVVEALDEMTKQRIREIKETLRRIDGEEWGVCSECGESIGDARLEAIPTATHCIRCASALDD